MLVTLFYAMRSDKSINLFSFQYLTLANVFGFFRGRT